MNQHAAGWKAATTEVGRAPAPKLISVPARKRIALLTGIAIEAANATSLV
jgi:hypothetical protein